MRVGLNSGEVVVRAIGNDLHMDYSAVGETTHLAARMEQLAMPGSIRLTASTFGRRSPSLRHTLVTSLTVRCIISKLPEAWTSNIRTPIRVASTAALATVRGMS